MTNVVLATGAAYCGVWAVMYGIRSIVLAAEKRGMDRLWMVVSGIFSVVVGFVTVVAAGGELSK